MTPRTCPDCNGGLRPGATKCRCGWTMPKQPLEATATPAVRCDIESCERPAVRKVGPLNICEECERAIREKRAREFCEEKGLRTVDQMRAWCKSVARKGYNGFSFERWCEVMTQRSVDLLVIIGTRSDERCLERLRAAGVIDGRFQVIPLEARKLAADAYAAERAHEIVQARERRREEKKTREPGEDDDEERAAA